MKDFSRFLADISSVPVNVAPIVMRCRIRLARNLADENFPDKLSPEKRSEVGEMIISSIENSGEFPGAYIFRMENLSSIEQKVLVERHLMSKDLVNRAGASVIIDPSQKISIMVNEEDHFRIQVVDAGSDLSEIWKIAEHADDVLGGIFNMAFSDRYGFLTACPTNLGTGLRASAMVHLPGLVMDGQMEKVVVALNKCGFAVRGWLGEGSDAMGSIFQISNQYTLGESEEKIISNLQEWLGGIVEQERNARRRVLSRGKTAFFDQVARVYGELRYSMILSEAEAIDMLSIMGMACNLGIFPKYVAVRIDELFMESQTAHVAFRGKISEPSQEGEGVSKFRAGIFREAFSMIPPPDFSSLS